ncbi:MAG: hypothetical protein Q8K65_11160, partial [Alphaproteobacteria bacterium]|nr:hypothetical protein [Alphaproteobacteria bacterium]
AELKLTGSETFDIAGIEADLKPGMELSVTMKREGGGVETFDVLCRIDTLDEIEYFKNGGILHYVLRAIARAA